jgi:hypothetical protein
MKRNKRAQITLFVILGIVLLILVLIIAYFSTRKTTTPAEKETKLPIEVSPIQESVTQCLYAVGKEAVFKLGAHGGYIDPASFGIRANSVAPTESNGVSIFPDSDVIPYWFYLKSNNKCTSDCVVTSEKPPLSADEGSRSIESQISNYIEDKINICFNNLSSFEERGIKVELVGQPKVETYVRAASILLVLNQNIKATYNGQEKTLSQFQTELPINLMSDYNLMNKIIEYTLDNNIRFFERSTLSLVGAYGLGEPPELPPLAGGTDIGSGKSDTWSFRESKSIVQRLLEDNTALYSVDNTRNSQIIITDNLAFNGIYMNYVMDVPYLKNPENYSVDFLYLEDWPIYLDIKPRNGDLIKPDITKLLWNILTIKKEQFYYDISYPLVIIIKDHEAFNGEGFTFQAAIEVNIRLNEPINISGESPLISDRSETLFCDEVQKQSGEVTVSVATTEPTLPEDITVSYNCGDETCFMGSPDFRGILISKFPLCADGFVTASAEDYHAKPARLTTSKDMPANIGLTIEPYKEVAVSIKKAVLTKVPFTSTWMFDPAAITDLGEDDKANIILTKLPEPGEDDVVESTEINGGIPPDEQPTVKLVEGEYAISGFIMTNLGPTSVSQKNITLTLPETSETVTFEEPMQTGILTMDENTGGLVSITKSDIETGRITLIIPYISIDDIQTMDDMTSMNDALNTISIYNRLELLPVFG